MAIISNRLRRPRAMLLATATLLFIFLTTRLLFPSPPVRVNHVDPLQETKFPQLEPNHHNTHDPALLDTFPKLGDTPTKPIEALLEDNIPSPTPSPINIENALPEYEIKPHNPAYCANRFGLQYLEELRDRPVSYCMAESSSNLTCFHSQTAKPTESYTRVLDTRTDTLCFGRAAHFDIETRRFSLGCKEREVPPAVPRLSEFTQYWYDTGPRAVLGERVLLNPGVVVEKPTQKFTILIKREGAYNLWHSIMEIWSMTMTLDVLRMAIDSTTNAPYFSLDDIENTQVMILDKNDDGPYFDLWSMFAKRPIVKVNDTTADLTNDENIIVPLAGASNPLWQGDWDVHNCERSSLLSTFSHRVLNFYNLDTNARPNNNDDIVLTFIDRKGTRRLVDHASYIEELQARVPHVRIQSIDFAELSFVDQIKTVRETDILVGVHGAGLTHGMFLPESSVMVEILPQGLEHKGFRNLAGLLGHSYFSAHGSIPGGEPDWAAEAAKKAQVAKEAVLAEIGRKDIEDKALIPGNNTEPVVIRKVAVGSKAIEPSEAFKTEAPPLRDPIPAIVAPETTIQKRQRSSKWQADDVFLERDRFMELMEVAIKVMYNKGSRNYDVN